jgi:GNAT superfamily N-acetyltransferase
MPSVPIRPPLQDELSMLRSIQRDSGQGYRKYGLNDVADHEPPSVEVFAAYVDDGRAWVSVDDFDQPIGFIIVDIIDGGAHIEQVSVLPVHQGEGIGRALIEHVEKWAVSMRLSALTLTTFGHIPWNRPLYEHLGFRVLFDDEIGPGIRRVCEAEASSGLDPDVRVVMRLRL